MEWASPGYLGSIRSKMLQEYGQDWWLEPGEVAPDRQPEMGSAQRKNAAAFLLMNLAFIATNLVRGGAIRPGQHSLRRYRKHLWLLIAIFVIGLSVIFLRGAIEMLRELATHF